MARLFVVSAPSGAGKTTLCRQLTNLTPDLAYSISYTTRPPRLEEKEGEDYFFIDSERFKAMVKAGEFLEWAEVFGHLYGTGRKQVEDFLNSGLDVLLDIDVIGAREIKQNYPEAVFIFILPSVFHKLIRRLEARGTENVQTRQKRLDQALVEIEAHEMYDYLVINDEVDRAVADLMTLIEAERLRLPKDKSFWDNFFQGSN